MSSLLVKNIQALVSCDGQDRVYEQINPLHRPGDPRRRTDH